MWSLKGTEASMWRGVLFAGAVLSLTAAPTALRAAPDPAGFIFVSSAVDPDIAVIDSASDTVVTRIKLPGAPRHVVALGRGKELVASDAAAPKLYVVDAVGGTVTRVVETGVAPVLLQLDRAGTVLAVADPDAGAVEFVRPAGGPTTRISGIKGMRSMVFVADGRLLVAHGSRIGLVDPADGRMVAELPVDGRDGPVLQIAADPGGGTAFAVQGDKGVLSVFDLKTLTRAPRLRLPPPVGRMLPSADSQFMLIPVAGGRALSIVSTWTLKESARIPMSAEVSGLGLGLFQSVSIGMSRETRSVQTVDLRDRRRFAPLALPGVPEAGAASPDGLKFYVALSDTGQVAVVDLRHSTVSHVIPDAVRGASNAVPAVGIGYCH
ncbi:MULTISPECIES: YncE family protein [Azospirillum]|nr:hypothetical protein [Azospirillum brasilense]